MDEITIGEMVEFTVETYLKNPRRSLMFVGPPGCGKSEAMENEVRNQLAEILGRPDFFVSTLIASQMGQEDLGIPWPTAADAEQGIFKHIVHSGFSFKEDAVGILFLDEILSADTNVTKALQNIVSAFRVYNKPTPKGVMIVGAANAKEHRAGVQTHNSAFNNRFIWVKVKPTYESWEPWAIKHGIHESIRSFLKKFPQHIFSFEPNREINATLRNWVKVNDFIGAKYESTAVIGLLGEGIATEFFAYKALFGEFPDIKDVELHPEKARVPKGKDAQFALSNALAQWTKKKNWSAFVRYVERMDSEYQFMYMREAARLHPECSLKSTSEWEKYIYTNQKDLV